MKIYLQFDRVNTKELLWTDTLIWRSTKPPFDKPLSFTRLFDKKMQMEIMAAINKVKDNAVVIAAWESVQHQFNDYRCDLTIAPAV